MTSVALRSILCIALGWALASCTMLEEKEEPPLMVRDCVAVGKRLVRAINEKNVDEFNELIDREGIVIRALHGLSMKFEDKKKLVRESAEGMGASLGTRIIESVGDEGSYSMLQLHAVGKETRLLVRKITQDGGLDYHDFVLGRDPHSDRIVVRDVYVYSTGELYSETLRRIFVKSYSRKVLGVSVQDADTSFVGMLSILEQMDSLDKLGEYDQALALYRGLSPSQRREKLALIRYMTSARSLGQQEHLRAINECIGYYPDEPFAVMLAIDKFAMLKQYDSMLAVERKLNKLVDGDPYLSYMQGIAHLLRKDTAAARSAFASAIRDEPGLKQPYRMMIRLYVLNEQFDAAVTVLDDYVRNCDASVDDLDSDFELYAAVEPGYAGLIKSTEYRNWRESMQQIDSLGGDESPPPSETRKHRRGR